MFNWILPKLSHRFDMSTEEHMLLNVHLNQLASNQFAKMLHVS